MLKSLALVLVLLLLLHSTAGAASRGEFYQTAVAVSGQGSGEREQAIRAALEQLLIRMTGRSDVREETAAAGLFADANRFVQQFRYESTADGLQLSVAFDGSGLRRALGEAGVAVWRNERPPVLVWLAVDGGGERFLLGAHEHEPLRLPLMAAARDVGLPLLLPLLDLEDLAEVSFADVWGGFGDSVRTASARYGEPVVVLARVYRDGDRWVGRWSQLDRRGDGAWQTSHRELDGTLRDGMTQLARRLSGEHAAVPRLQASSDRLLVQVEGVEDLGGYLALKRYLGAVGGVRGADLSGVSGNVVEFRLALEASPERVLRRLREGDRLSELDAVEVDTDELLLAHRFRIRR